MILAASSSEYPRESRPAVKTGSVSTRREAVRAEMVFRAGAEHEVGSELDVVRAERHGVRSDQRGDVVDVIEEILERRLLRSDEVADEADADIASRRGKGVDLLVGEVPRVVAQRFRVRVRADDGPRARCRGGPRTVPRRDARRR